MQLWAGAILEGFEEDSELLELFDGMVLGAEELVARTTKRRSRF